MTVYLIRHSMTAGNLEHRYNGRGTDEPLCTEGRELAEKKSDFIQKLCPDAVFSSSMKRCIQTAEIIFPNKNISCVPMLAECNFGDFEGKNYTELNGDVYYQNWIDSGGTIPFPNGESKEEFTARSCKAFADIILSCKCESIAIVAHGGTFMSILSEYELSKKPYFEWRIPFCEPICCKVESLCPVLLALDKA